MEYVKVHKPDRTEEVNIEQDIICGAGSARPHKQSPGSRQVHLTSIYQSPQVSLSVSDHPLLTNGDSHVMPSLYEFVRKPTKSQFDHPTNKHHFTNVSERLNLLYCILLINQPLHSAVHPPGVVDILLGAVTVVRDLAQVHTQGV